MHKGIDKQILIYLYSITTLRSIKERTNNKWKDRNETLSIRLSNRNYTKRASMWAMLQPVTPTAYQFQSWFLCFQLSSLLTDSGKHQRWSKVLGFLQLMSEIWKLLASAWFSSDPYSHLRSVVVNGRSIFPFP